MDDIPQTKWESLGGGENSGYADRFVELIEKGDDIDGEARLADALSPRCADILDAGSGIGRVAAALARVGHRVVACEKDPYLVAKSHELYPDLPVLAKDILELDEGDGSYDTIVLVGNVLVFAAEGSQSRMLAVLRQRLQPTGRILVGFHVDDGPAVEHPYPVADFERDVATAGLTIQHRFGGYELQSVTGDYLVAVLTQGAA